MALLFVGGAMNLLWIGGLAVFVLIEKVLLLGNWVGRLAGIAAIAWGACDAGEHSYRLIASGRAGRDLKWERNKRCD